MCLSDFPYLISNQHYSEKIKKSSGILSGPEHVPAQSESGRTPDMMPAMFQNVSIDHLCFDTLMTRQLPDRSD